MNNQTDLENVDAAVAWQKIFLFFSSADCVSFLFCHPGAIAVAWRGINNQTDQVWQTLGSDKMYYQQCGRQCVSSEIYRYCTVDCEGVGFRFPSTLVECYNGFCTLVYKLFVLLEEWRMLYAIAHGHRFCSCRDWWKIISNSSHFPCRKRHLRALANGTLYRMIQSAGNLLY